jgi:hypothetical protein
MSGRSCSYPLLSTYVPLAVRKTTLVCVSAIPDADANVPLNYAAVTGVIVYGSEYLACERGLHTAIRFLVSCKIICLIEGNKILGAI